MAEQITPAARRAARDESAWAEQERNRRLAENIAAGTDVLRGRTDEVINGVRGMAVAHLDVPGPRALQLIEEIDRLRAELARLRGIEERACKVRDGIVTNGAPWQQNAQIARHILGETS
jgi:hypothetical protein